MSLRRTSAAVLVTVALFVLVTTPAVAGPGDPDPINNNQPDIALPGSLTTPPVTPVTFSAMVSDPDVGSGNMEMEIDLSDLDGVGGRSVPAGDYGTFTWGGGAGLTSDLELQDLTAQNADLASITYTPPTEFAGTARIVFEIDDQGNTGVGGVLSRTRFIDISVAVPGDGDPAVNTQPDITLPAPLTTPTNTPISFAPTVSDPDVGPFDMEMEIDISDLDGIGGLSVPAGDYGTFSWGGGSGLTTDIDVDTMSAVNTDLSTFTYTPAPGFVGLARIVFEIDDQGHTGSEFPPVVLSRTRFIDITVTPTADLAVTKTAPGSVIAGNNITYDLTILNNGPEDATSVALSDTLPAGTTFVSLTQTLGSAFTLTTPPVGGTGTVTATTGTLLAGASAEFDLTVTVGAGVADGSTITNTASATTATTDSDSTNNSDSTDTDVVNLADLSITKTGTTSVNEGDNITYTLMVVNNGPAAAQSVALSDPLPTGTTFVSMTQTLGSAFTLTTPPVGGTGTVTATAASMAAGASAAFQLVVNTGGGSGETTITNTATVTSSIGDPDPSNNSDSFDTTVEGADVSITKTGPPSVDLGDQIVYTVEVSNAGPADAQSVVVTDVVPAGTTFVSATQEDGPGATITVPPVGDTGTVTAAITTLNAGETATFAIVVDTVGGTPGGSVVNTATAATASGDPDTSNNASTVSTLLEAADLVITQTGPAAVVAGESLTYSLTLGNDGPTDASGVELTDVLASDATFISLNQLSGPAMDCATPLGGETGEIHCSLPALPALTRAEFVVMVRVNSGAPNGSTLVSTATVAADGADPDASNNEAVVETQVETEVNLVVAKTGPGEAPAGSDMTYELGVRNLGPSDAQGVDVSDVLPAGTTFVSVTQTDGPTATCTTPAVGAAGTVTCSIPSLDPDAFAHFDLVLHLDSSATPGTSITNQATVVSDTTDTDPDSNTVVSGAALVLSATNTPLPATGADALGLADAAVLLMLCGAAVLLLTRPDPGAEDRPVT